MAKNVGLTVFSINNWYKLASFQLAIGQKVLDKSCSIWKNTMLKKILFYIILLNM